jgi:hypothetical protein
MNKRQDMASLSNVKEYMTTTNACKEAICLMKLCLEVGLSQKYIPIKCDSNSAIHVDKNPTFHAKTNNIYIYIYPLPFH